MKRKTFFSHTSGSLGASVCRGSRSHDALFLVSCFLFFFVQINVWHVNFPEMGIALHFVQ